MLSFYDLFNLDESLIWEYLDEMCVSRDILEQCYRFRISLNIVAIYKYIMYLSNNLITRSVVTYCNEDAFSFDKSILFLLLVN